MGKTKKKKTPNQQQQGINLQESKLINYYDFLKNTKMYDQIIVATSIKYCFV